MEEHELVNNAKAGDKLSIELLYRSTFTYIYKYVLCSVNDNDLTDDIVSTVYINVFTKLSSFRGESSFKTWIHTLARNEIYNYYRSKSITNKFVVIDDDLIASEDSAEIDRSEIDEKIELKEVEDEKRVAEVLDKLKPRYAEILKLRYLSSMTIKECSEYLKITENNVKVLQNRALKQASKLLVQERN